MRTKQQFVQQFVAPCLEPLGTRNGSWGALGEPSLKNAIKTVVFIYFTFPHNHPNIKGSSGKPVAPQRRTKKGSHGKPYALQSKNEEPRRVKQDVKKDQKWVQEGLVETSPRISKNRALLDPNLAPEGSSSPPPGETPFS